MAFCLMNSVLSVVVGQCKVLRGQSRGLGLDPLLLPPESTRAVGLSDDWSYDVFPLDGFSKVSLASSTMDF